MAGMAEGAGTGGIRLGFALPQFGRLTGDAASSGQVEVHGTRRTTSISLRNPRLLDLSAVLRLVPKVVERVLARTRNARFLARPFVTVAIEGHRGLAVVFGVRLPRALTAAFIHNAPRASEGIAGLS